MKLYTYDPAPNPRRLALFLQYKGIELDTEQVDLGAGEQLGDAHRAINPGCAVPALVLDDGKVLDAVIGICVYLEELHPDRPLMGSTALEKAEVIGWCHKLFNGLITATASVLRNGNKAFVNRALPGPLDLPQIPALVERGRTQIDHLLPGIDAHLGESRWMAGESFSQADIDLLVAVEFLGWIKAEVPAECANLHAWLARAQAELG